MAQTTARKRPRDPRMKVACITHTGLVRTGNEDALCIGSLVMAGQTMDSPVCYPLEELTSPGEPFWIAVADGMGGHAGGEVASSLAVHGLQHWERQNNGPPSVALTVLSQLLHAAAREGRPHNMGTTLSALYCTPDHTYLVHTGDSRIYSLSPFAQLTRDNTQAQQLIDSGRLTLSERNSHPSRHYLTEALLADRPAPKGTKKERPPLSMKNGSADSLYLLCTDGLWDNFTFDELSQICSLDVETAARRLVDLTLERGADDNFTLILLGQ